MLSFIGLILSIAWRFLAFVLLFLLIALLWMFKKQNVEFKTRKEKLLLFTTWVNTVIMLAYCTFLVTVLTVFN